jgi:hypothetical protein
MDIHKNARLTLRSREALVETVIGGLAFSRAAALGENTGCAIPGRCAP